jgi:hypothetical protein
MLVLDSALSCMLIVADQRHDAHSRLLAMAARKQLVSKKREPAHARCLKQSDPMVCSYSLVRSYGVKYSHLFGPTNTWA